MSASGKAHVLLTGATGFVGKVVLAELLRRREELGIEKVSVLVRATKTKRGDAGSARRRFRAKVVPAAIFRDLPAAWTEWVQVVEGDLEAANAGLGAAERERLRTETTHIIHCAASIDFDLPVKEAASANIDSALAMLDLARGCEQLQSMVSLSTAYVSTWKSGPIEERLAHLPRPAEELYRAIKDGTRSEADLLAESGHPNTYTYTKCITEHLLTAQRGAVPLAIVRPSIVSTSWKEPFPGWIDSPAALAGCLLYASLGVIPALHAHPSTRLDVIPVDLLSKQVIETSFRGAFPKAGEQVPIFHATMGIERAIRIDRMVTIGARFFQSRPGARKVRRMPVVTKDHGFRRYDLYRRAMPTALLDLALTVTGQPENRQRLLRADERVRHLNKAFGYFTHHTFDFQASQPAYGPDYDPEAYMESICSGMYKHLLQKDESELTLAGAKHDDARNDIAWGIEKPDGNWAIRWMGVGTRKVLRKSTDCVTWDRPAFERAVAAAKPDSLFVLAPSHRSYFDFLLASYLCFQHPELGIPVPHIAAAQDFSRLPMVGELLRQSRAFYIPRGVKREVAEVTEALRHIVEKDSSLMFFVEGQRSRSRHALPPKRGLLRGLQKTGRTFTVLPIAFSYDRLPEEGAFERELAGADRPKMSVRAILSWLTKLTRGDVHLGRVHIGCGEPLTLDPQSDVRALSERLIGEQQRHTATTSFHLRTFLARNPLPDIDEVWLSQAIQKRGGRVLDSSLPTPEKCSTALEQSLNNQWMHWFFADALALYPNHPVIRDYVDHHLWFEPPAMERNAEVNNDPRLRQLIDALFTPIIEDYRLPLRLLRSPEWSDTTLSSSEIVRSYPAASLPVLDGALRFLAERGMLRDRSDGRYERQAPGSELETLRRSWSAPRLSHAARESA